MGTHDAYLHEMSDEMSDRMNATDASINVSISSQSDGSFPNTVNIAVTRAISDTPPSQVISGNSIIEVIEKMGGIESAAYIKWIWKHPVWLWRRLARGLPRRWCGKYDTNSKYFTAKSAEESTRG